jgi:hypothetical protein
MIVEIFDDGKEPTPNEKKMMQALMHGGMLKYKYTKEGQIEVDVIPVHDLYLDAPKDDIQ